MTSPALREARPPTLCRSSKPVSPGRMLSIAKVAPGAGWRYYFRGVMVGDGHRPARKALRAAQEMARRASPALA